MVASSGTEHSRPGAANTRSYEEFMLGGWMDKIAWFEAALTDRYVRLGVGPR